MKKRVLSSVFDLALLATTGWGVNKSMSNNAGLSDLALANVEALANNESPQSGDPCYSSGRFDLDEPKVVVCDNPCKLKNWRLGWFPSKSYCP